MPIDMKNLYFAPVVLSPVSEFGCPLSLEMDEAPHFSAAKLYVEPNDILHENYFHVPMQVRTQRLHCHLDDDEKQELLRLIDDESPHWRELLPRALRDAQQQRSKQHRREPWLLSATAELLIGGESVDEHATSVKLSISDGLDTMPQRWQRLLEALHTRIVIYPHFTELSQRKALVSDDGDTIIVDESLANATAHDKTLILTRAAVEVAYKQIEKNKDLICGPLNKLAADSCKTGTLIEALNRYLRFSDPDDPLTGPSLYGDYRKHPEVLFINAVLLKDKLREEEARPGCLGMLTPWVRRVKEPSLIEAKVQERMTNLLGDSLALSLEMFECAAERMCPPRDCQR